MKKKSILVFLLALVSTASLGAVACKKAEEHQHNWSYKSNNDLHWQNCGDCDAAKDFGVHNDADKNGSCDVCGAGVSGVNWLSDDNNHWVDNNGDKVGMGGHVDENDDGHCDTCDKLLKETVTFDTNGLCDVAPASVDHGTAVAKPADPEAQGFIFAGWYTDSEFETAFDFKKPVTEATTVYAKWEDDTTAGCSAKYPITIDKPGVPASHSFGKFNKLYFKYTATETNRFNAFLGAGQASAACAFTTDLDGDPYTNADEIGGSVYFDLEKGESVIVEVVRGENLTNEQKIEVYVDLTQNEPVPKTGWHGGVWENPETEVSVTIDDKTNKVLFNDKEYVFRFVGGANAKLTFEADNTTYTISALQAEILFISGGSTNCTLIPYVKPDPIDISKFSGIYENKDGSTVDKFNYLKKICIYSSGNGYIVRGSAKESCILGDKYASFDQERNVLTYYFDYRITVNLNEDGEPESVTVKYNGATAVYTRTADSGDEIPAKLPLDDDSTYYGENGGKIDTDSMGSQHINGSGYRVIIENYIAAENKYFVKVGDKNYTLIVEGTGKNAVVKMLDEAGAVTDTLSVFEPVYVDLSRIDQNITLAADDFTRKYYFYKITEEGYYKFTSDVNGLSVYVNVSESDLFDGEITADLTADGNSVYLTVGAIVGVSVKNCEQIPSNVTLKVEPGLPPYGLESERPLTAKVNDNGVVAINMGSISVDNESGNYYAEITNVKAGNYYMCISLYDDNMEDYTYPYYYTVNGVEYGRKYNQDTWTYDYFGGISATNNYAKITVEEGTDKLSIVVNGKGVIRLWSDPLSDVKELEFNGDSGSITQNGKYKCENFGNLVRVESLTFTCETEFTVYIDGLPTTAKKLTLTKDQLEKGFTIDLADSATVEFNADYSVGAQKNPYKFDTIGSVNFNHTEGQLTYIEIDLSKYTLNTDFVLSFESAKQYYFQINGEGTKYGYGVKDGVMEPLENLAYKHNVTDEASKKLLIVVGSDVAGFGGYLTLSVVVGIEELAQPLTFSTIPIGESLISFTSLNASQGDSNLVVKAAAATTMVFTGVSPFKLLLANGTVKEAVLTNGNYIVDNLAFLSGENKYIRIISDEEQQIIVATTYLRGSEAYPYTLTFKNGAADLQITSGANNFYTIESGTYKFTTNSNYCSASIGQTAIEKNKLFTVEETALISFYCSGKANVTLTLTVPESMQRLFVYTDADDLEHEVNVKEDGLTLDGVAYSLDSKEGDVYTFVADSDDGVLTVNLTLNPDGLKFGEYDMEIKISEIFTPDQVGVYSGTWGTPARDISIKFDAEGKGEMYLLNSSLQSTLYTFKKITDNGDGTYTVVHNEVNVKFKFVDGGVSLTQTTSAFGALTFNLTHYYMFTAEQAGKYEGKVVIYPAAIEFDRNGAGTMTLPNSGGSSIISSFSSITDNLNGTYTVKATNGEAVFNFNSDGSITFTQIPEATFTATLTKTHMFTEKQAGEYTGNMFSKDISISFDVDGKGSMTMPLDASNPMAAPTTETITQIVKNSNDTYTINGKVTFRFTSDGIVVTSIPSGAANCLLTKPQVALPELVPGTYSGQLGGWKDVVLTINSDGTVTFREGETTYENLKLTFVNDSYTFTIDFGFGTTDYTFTVNNDDNNYSLYLSEVGSDENNGTLTAN